MSAGPGRTSGAHLPTRALVRPVTHKEDGTHAREAHDPAHRDQGGHSGLVIVLGTATVTVGAASPEVHDTVHNVVAAVTGQTVEADKNECDKGQPAAVAQRNAATKLIDAAFQKDHKALEDLRGTPDDNKAAADLIKTADEKLKGLRTKALNDVAALALGREGQNKTDESTATTTTTTSAWHRPRPRTRRRPIPASRIRKAACRSPCAPRSTR